MNRESSVRDVPEGEDININTDLSALGNNTPYHEHSSQTEPDPNLLERFPAPEGGDLRVDIETSEFTSLCPITAQPDWATIKVSYEPEHWCLESKSYKLYLMGYRNYGSFHEAIVQRIASDLIQLLEPKWIKVVGGFTPRGGISFQPTAEWAR